MIPITNQNADDLLDHVETYRAFLKVTGWFVFHVAVILALMAYFLL